MPGKHNNCLNSGLEKGLLLTLVLFVILLGGCSQPEQSSYESIVAGAESVSFRWDSVSETAITDPRILDIVKVYLSRAADAEAPKISEGDIYTLKFTFPDRQDLEWELVHFQDGSTYVNYLEGWKRVADEMFGVFHALSDYGEENINTRIDPVDQEFLSEWHLTPLFLINSFQVQLPDHLIHQPGEFPQVIYWAYNNQLNRDIGMDLTPYLGQEVNVNLYKIAELLPDYMAPRRESARVVIVKDGRKVIGAWLDVGRHYGFACSLTGKTLQEITGLDDNQFFATLIDPDNPLEKELSALEPEEIIAAYYDAIDQRDYQRAHTLESRKFLLNYLFSNMDNRFLYNPDYNDADSHYGLSNIVSARVKKIERYEQTEDYHPEGTRLYMVTVDLQVEHASVIESGNKIFFIALRRETPETGWRIDSIGTGP